MLQRGFPHDGRHMIGRPKMTIILKQYQLRIPQDTVRGKSDRDINMPLLQGDVLQSIVILGNVLKLEAAIGAAQSWQATRSILKFWNGSQTEGGRLNGQIGQCF